MSSDKEEFKKVAKESYKKFSNSKTLWKWGIGGAITIAAAGILIPMAVKTSDEGTNNNLNNIAVADSLIKDDVKIPAQHFLLNTKNDTVVETKEGIVFALSKESFVDESGKPVEGGIDVVVKEAMNAESIISSGLSTTSNGELLETAGMFYISAYANGKELKINPNKPVHAQVPTNEIKPGMKLFSGEKLPNGQINWVNPIELEKYLVPVEITSLNFYPPNYENKLAELGYDEKNKKWKDSLYYSFALNTNPGSSFTSIGWDGNTDSVYEIENTKPFTHPTNYINPIKIQTIWNTKFNNTLLATKEFEERLKVIFSTCDNSILELYINNMQKNMYEIDEMAYAKTNNYKFKEFSERKDGKVKTNDAFAKSLSTYYEQQSKKNQEAVTALRNKYYQKQNELNQQFNNKQNKQAQKEAEIAANNFNKEFTKNLEETYKQLGFKKAEPQNYKATVTTTGWKNIDAYVLEATVTRTTTNITYNGKTATITYKPFGVEVADKASYDRIYAYLLADGLYSFQRMNEKEAGFTEKLNGFFTYRLVVVGYKGEQAYLFQHDALSKDGGKIVADMKTVSADELKSALQKHNKMSNDVIEDLQFEKIKVENEKRLKENLKMEAMREKLCPVIAPCESKSESIECGWISINPGITHSLLFGGKYIETEKFTDSSGKEFWKEKLGSRNTWKFSSDRNTLYIGSQSIPIKWINKKTFEWKIDNGEIIEGGFSIIFKRACAE